MNGNATMTSWFAQLADRVLHIWDGVLLGGKPMDTARVEAKA